MTDIGTAADAARHCAKARELAAAGDPAGAFSVLCLAFVSHAAYAPAYDIAVEVLPAFGDAGAEAAALFKAAVIAPTSAEAFRALGEDFERRGHGLAIAFYGRANALAPDDPGIAYNYSCVLCDRARPSLAYDVQKNAPPDEFFQQFQMYWAALLAERDLDEVRAFLTRSRPHINNTSLPEDVRAEIANVLGKLSEALDRMAAVGPPMRHIRDWQFIQYGSAVLLPFDDGDEVEVSGGRWAYIQASPEMIAKVLVRLKRLLGLSRRRPTHVYWLGDRDSEVLARAAALMLNLPVLDSRDVDGYAQRPQTLLVAARTSDFAIAGLQTTSDDQTLFAFDLPFLNRQDVTPDVVGVLAQTCVLPWSGGFRVLNTETLEFSQAPVDTRPAAEIAIDIVAKTPEALAGDRAFSRHLEFYRQHASWLTGRVAGAKRRTFLAESPLPASIFGV